MQPSPIDIMREVGRIVDGAVVADVAGDDPRVDDAGGRHEVRDARADRVRSAPRRTRPANSQLLDELRSEGLRDAKEVPIAAAIAVFDQGGDLVGGEAAVR